MPVVAVVGGIATAAGAAAGATALIGGTITLSTVASGLAFVGGVASALGAVTGNKKLMKFGMIAGVAGLAAGGVNGLMSNAGAGDAAAAAAPTGLDKAVESMTTPGVSDMAREAATGSSAEPYMFTQQAQQGAQQGGSFMSQAPTTSTPMEPPSTGPTVEAAKAIQARAPETTVSSGSGFAPSATDTMAGATSQLRQQKVANDTSVFGKFGGFINNNPSLATMGSGILGGLGQGMMASEQQKEAERMDAEKRARINASILGQVQR